MDRFVGHGAVGSSSGVHVLVADARDGEVTRDERVDKRVVAGTKPVEPALEEKVDHGACLELRRKVEPGHRGAEIEIIFGVCVSEMNGFGELKLHVHLSRGTTLRDGRRVSHVEKGVVTNSCRAKCRVVCGANGLGLDAQRFAIGVQSVLGLSHKERSHLVLAIHIRIDEAVHKVCATLVGDHQKAALDAELGEKPLRSRLE
mmetsp:Transcript_13434/g.28973  ORF Transcript_13434/g.28973 Transcript_13434/m.28973 type:complete len:202 (+) Transcript_13434:628-1233(+)